jgi:hypothetical protein
MVGRRSLARDRKKSEHNRNGDIESATNHKYPKFKDAVELAMAERTTALLKRQLHEALDVDDFKKYRKDKDEVGVDVPRDKTADHI